jgi:hypothetical protein
MILDKRQKLSESVKSLELWLIYEYNQTVDEKPYKFLVIYGTIIRCSKTEAQTKSLLMLYVI